MPDFQTFNLPKLSDGVLTINMTPPFAVGGLAFRFTLAERFDASTSGIILTRSCDSGYGGGQSGVTVTDSGQGQFQVTTPTPEEMSGRNPGNYAYQFECLSSGQRGPLTQGYCVLGPNARF